MSRCHIICLADQPWMPCWIRRWAARLSGVHWDGHCASDSGKFCIDCGREL